jgi:hydrogenase maturation protein HypF
MLGMQLASPQTSAAGRLFDGASALAGLCHDSSFEGEAPMRLEAACSGTPGAGVPLPLSRDVRGVWRSDWAPLVELMLDGRLDIGARATRFHAALARVVVDQARAVAAEHPVRCVGLAGGVFQNRTLTGLAIDGLRAAGFTPLLPAQVPPNDAGISYGQVIEAVARGAIQ